MGRTDRNNHMNCNVQMFVLCSSMQHGRTRKMTRSIKKINIASCLTGPCRPQDADYDKMRWGGKTRPTTFSDTEPSGQFKVNWEGKNTSLYIYTPYRYMFIVSIIIFRLSYRVCYSLMFIHTEVSIMCVHVNDVYIGKFVLVTSPILSFWLKLVQHIWNAMPTMRFW